MRKQRLLFVCVGNACRSPMAEGIARALGSDIVEAESAGIAPAYFLPALTEEVMRDKNIDVSSHFSKGLDAVDLASFDLVINMSGFPLPRVAPVREWDVPDPIGGRKPEYQQTARLIESLVADLIAEIRSSAP